MAAVEVIGCARNAAEPASVGDCAPPGPLERRARPSGIVPSALVLHDCDEQDGYQGREGDYCKNYHGIKVRPISASRICLPPQA
jgi:hypothetical protein